MDIAQRLRDTIAIRLYEMNLKQKDLAEALCVPPSTLNSWLKRDRDIPAHYILGIAEFLDCSPMYILTGDITYQIDPQTLIKPEQRCGAGNSLSISADALHVAELWEKLDEHGKAIVLGDIHKRLEVAETRAEGAAPDEGLLAKEA